MPRIHEDTPLKVAVVNPPFPQLTQLASALAKANALHAYVTPLVATGCKLERNLTRLPIIGRKIASDLRRRPLPPDIPVGLSKQAGIEEEILRVALRRLPRPLAAMGRPAADRIMYRRNRRLSQAGANALDGANVVVASHGTALEVFAKAGEQGALRVLDYPIAHHRFSTRLLGDEAEKNPDFAATLQWQQFPEAFERRLDAECEQADYILTGSSFARTSFIEEGISPSKVVAIPYGVDISKFEPCTTRESNGVFRVLFVGSIGQRKGISYLLEGYRRFAKQDTELILVGNYVGDPKVFAPYRHLYTHVPHVPHSQVPAIFSNSSVFVFPSLLEGMGIVVLEAMASGLPVIVTANGPGDIVRDGVDGFVVPAGDSEAITHHLKLLYREPALREKMGRQARDRAAEFDWEQYTRKTVDLLRSSLAKQSIESGR